MKPRTAKVGTDHDSVAPLAPTIPRVIEKFSNFQLWDHDAAHDATPHKTCDIPRRVQVLCWPRRELVVRGDIVKAVIVVPQKILKPKR